MVAGRMEDRNASFEGKPLPIEQMMELDGMVRSLAGKLRARLPSQCGVEMADLIQAGNVGLLQAARTFEPGRGAPLAGYAKFRIRGEMLDMVRRNMGGSERFHRCRPTPTDRQTGNREFRLLPRVRRSSAS